MTTPPADGPSSPDPDARPWDPAAPDPLSSEQVSLDKPEPPFDPYRYGAPEQPVPPEYAPPGYTPPPVTGPQRPYPPPGPPAYPAQGYPTQGYPAPGYPAPGHPAPANPYGAPPYSQQYPQPRTGNGKAIAGLVLGILAIVFCWTSVFDVIFVALGVIFGLIGLGESKRVGTGRGMAIGGLVCAIVGALLATLFTVVYVRISPCLDSNKYTSGSSAQSTCISDRI